MGFKSSPGVELALGLRTVGVPAPTLLWAVFSTPLKFSCLLSGEAVWEIREGGQRKSEGGSEGRRREEMEGGEGRKEGGKERKGGKMKRESLPKSKIP